MCDSVSTNMYMCFIDVRTYIGTYILNMCYYMCVYVCMYPDAWAFSINFKSADRSTFAMYWGTFVMYPSFCKWHYLI